MSTNKYTAVGKLPKSWFITYWLPGAPSFTAEYETEEDAREQVNSLLNGWWLMDNHRAIVPRRFFLSHVVSDDYFQSDFLENRISKNKVLDSNENHSLATVKPGFRSSTNCLNSSKKSGASSNSKESIKALE